MDSDGSEEEEVDGGRDNRIFIMCRVICSKDTGMSMFYFDLSDVNIYLCVTGIFCDSGRGQVPTEALKSKFK